MYITGGAFPSLLRCWQVQANIETELFARATWHKLGRGALTGHESCVFTVRLVLCVQSQNSGRFNNPCCSTLVTRTLLEAMTGIKYT